MRGATLRNGDGALRSAWISQSNSRAKLSPVASRALDDIVGPAMDTVSSLDGAAPRRLIVGITGGTGAAFGVKLLQTLRDSPLETHLVMCDCSRATILAETGLELGQIRKLADRVYAHGNQAARISSGSFLTEGMVIAPCSMRSLAAIANGLAT